MLKTVIKLIKTIAILAVLISNQLIIWIFF